MIYGMEYLAQRQSGVFSVQIFHHPAEVLPLGPQGNVSMAKRGKFGGGKIGVHPRVLHPAGLQRRKNALGPIEAFYQWSARPCKLQ